MKSPTRAFSVILLVVVLVVSCARTPLVLSPNANDVQVGKGDPARNAKELGPITGSNGSGCGLYGRRGTYEGAYIQLKNTAAALGANYVQIYRISEPHLSGNCFVNVFSISGMAYRINPIEDSSRNATVSGGTCFSVASDGLILTAYHLIKDANNIKVRFEGAEELTAIPEQI